MEEWAENCAITGLPLNADAPVWVTVISTDRYHDDNKGPCEFYGLLTNFVAGLYNDEGGVVIDTSDPENVIRYQTMLHLLGRSRPFPYDVLSPAELGGSNAMYVVSRDSLDFLGKLPPVDETDGPTLEKAAKKTTDALYEACKEFVGTDNEDANPDDFAYHWVEIVPAEDPFPYYGSMCQTLFSANKDALLLGLQMYTQTRIMYDALRETRRKFFPNFNSELDLPRGGHKAVAELARFTRRKAIHAGFAGQPGED